MSSEKHTFKHKHKYEYLMREVCENTFLKRINNDVEFIRNENNNFYYRIIMDTNKYDIINSFIKKRIEIKIREHRNKITNKESNIRIHYDVNDKDIKVRLIQNIEIKGNKITTEFKYLIDDNEYSPYNIIMEGFILYCMDWMEKKINEL